MMNDKTSDLLDRLMSWSLPVGTAEQLAKLDRMWEEVGALCGPEKVADFPKEPDLLRERLIYAVEAYIEECEAKADSR